MDRFGLDAVNNGVGGVPGFGAGGQNPFDLFEGIFGGGGGIFGVEVLKEVWCKEIGVSLDDIFNETKLNMSLNSHQKCA